MTIKALRVGGEQHKDLALTYTDVTTKRAQHSALVKEKHYKKSGWAVV